ncbi:hypothetical protein SmJEL517_g02225 [Synchytrium microbalum]|uniref:Protein PNS1 n=1 Tax=Synchytrium microbalum TaxID=1806994 RepID=A0A507C779_9FUNG|nr:uncharacterized protein SmJEL517_g02225 [Synchytrium microbalum]TPX35361.1 hypothetical protein SmJEL517_g02225 [Synchytrium microbalum]
MSKGYKPLSASALVSNSLYGPTSNNRNNTNNMEASTTSSASGLFTPQFFDEELGPPIRPTLSTGSFMRVSPNDKRFDHQDNAFESDDDDLDYDGSSSMAASTVPGAWGPSGVFSKGFGRTVPSKSNPLFDKLLPDADLDDQPNPYANPSDRPYADPLFGILFIISFAAMFITGIVLLFTTSSVPFSSIVPGSVYGTLYKSSGLLTMLTTLAIGVGALWIWTMKRFVRPIVYLTVVAIPLSSLSLFAVLFTNSIVGIVNDSPDLSPQYSGSIVVSLVTLAISALACDVLQANPSVFLYSLGLMGGFVVFSIVWLIFFSRLWLINGVNGAGFGNNASPIAIIFFLFMYFWSSSIFHNVEKTMIAGVVAQWYFNPSGRRRVIHHINGGDDLLGGDSDTSSDKTKRALTVAVTTSFGSIAFASMIMAIVSTSQAIVRFIRRRTQKMDRVASSWLVYVDSMLTTISTLTENLNSYSLVYCALTASSFCEAALTCTRLFRRNLVLGLVTSTVTRLVLGLGVGSIALGTGTWAFFYASRGMNSPYAWVVGVVGAIIPYFVVNFLSSIVQHTVDACFIYYLMDLDSDSCHCEPAHRIFGSTQS